MEQNEYRDLIGLVEERLRELGLGFLADGANYIVDDRDVDVHRLLPPQERLVEMLAAFERFLASQDQATVGLALSRINEALIDGRVEDARFSPLAGDVTAHFSLIALPELRQLRDELLTLLVELREDTGR